MKYADVAGIDAVKDDIKVAMDMLLGAPAFRAMGARPYRVRSQRSKILPGLVTRAIRVAGSAADRRVLLTQPHANLDSCLVRHSL